MSHPIPGHTYGENESGYEPDVDDVPVHEKKTAMAKSMRRHRARVGKEHKGMYPGFAQDMLKDMMKKIRNNKKRT